jgi:hypothetical protein
MSHRGGYGCNCMKCNPSNYSSQVQGQQLNPPPLPPIPVSCMACAQPLTTGFGSLCNMCQSKVTSGLIESIKDTVPLVPSFLNRTDLPVKIEHILQTSGIYDYLTRDFGMQRTNELTKAAANVLGSAPLLTDIDPELFLRSLTTGWQHIVLPMVETNHVAIWADQHYKTLMVPWRKNAPVRDYRTSGAPGFQETAVPDWDMAIGKLLGYRKWTLTMPTSDDVDFEPNDGDEPELVGSYSQNFLSHYKMSDGRRVAVCANTAATHPKDDVPADNDCGCGWWAYWSPKEADNHGGHGGSLYDMSVTVAVEGSGRVVIGQKGFRAQYLKIIGIAPSGSFGAYCSEQLNVLRKFAAARLDGCPVFGTADEMKKETGLDENYGTLASRYPELAHYGNNDLALYTQLLTQLQSKVKGELTEVERQYDTARSDVEFMPNYMGRPDVRYLSSSVRKLRDHITQLRSIFQLLSSEYMITDYLLTERGCDSKRAYRDLIRIGSDPWRPWEGRTW